MKAACTVLTACLALGATGCDWFGDDDGEAEPDGGPADGSADTGVDAAPCDPNGTWTLTDPVTYSCCDTFSVQIDELEILDDGATVRPIQLAVLDDGAVIHPTTRDLGELSGTAVDCPGGELDNAATGPTLACEVTARVQGTLVDSSRWEGTFELTFEGLCCGGGPACPDATIDFTATR